MKSLIYVPVGPTATLFARVQKKSRNSLFHYLWKTVFRIHDILVRIRIRGLEPLTNGTGSCSFRQWHSRRKNNFFSREAQKLYTGEKAEPNFMLLLHGVPLRRKRYLKIPWYQPRFFAGFRIRVLLRRRRSSHWITNPIRIPLQSLLFLFQDASTVHQSLKITSHESKKNQLVKVFLTVLFLEYLSGPWFFEAVFLLFKHYQVRVPSLWLTSHLLSALLVNT